MKPLAVAIALATAAFFSNPAAAAQTELLSLRGLPVGENQYIDQFHIQTWNVQILAVCHFPGVWRITAGQFLGYEGVLSGETEAGMGYVRQADLKKLEGLFLVSVDGYQSRARRNQPATFAGSIHVGTFGNDPKEHRVLLKATNFVRSPASRCPG
jgi:hypothetical protein